jgi:hypothetical protein
LYRAAAAAIGWRLEVLLLPLEPHHQQQWGLAVQQVLSLAPCHLYCSGYLHVSNAQQYGYKAKCSACI